jgi:hypothetical protein
MLFGIVFNAQMLKMLHENVKSEISISPELLMQQKAFFSVTV